MKILTLPWGRFLSASPAEPQKSQPPAPPRLEPVSPGDPRRRKPSWKTGMLVIAALVLAVIAWNQRDRLLAPRQTAPASSVPVAAAVLGDFQRTLRISGTVAARSFAAIRAPRMQGGREARGASALTLIELAEPGSTVAAGETVARFEHRWLEDYIDDLRSSLTQLESNVEKRRAEIMIARETEEQALSSARAARDKAALDLRTAEVRSEIEAELLRLALEEAEASLKQIEQEVQLQETAHQAELRSLGIQVEKERLRLERHLRDLEKIRTETPVGGLVVLESIYRGGGQFDQVQSGDEVNPGTFFMRVVDLSAMIVSGSLNQADSHPVRIGQKAEVRLDAYPDMVLPGRVVGMGAMATSGGGRGWWRRGGETYVKHVGIEVSIDAAEPRVIPDLSASADILLEKQEGRLLIPRSAVRGTDEEPYVLLRRGNSFSQRKVVLGPMNAFQAVVLDGLAQGDEVALQDVSKL